MLFDESDSSSDLIFDASEVDDGRGRYPVLVRARTSLAQRNAVKQAAAREQISVHEFIRRAIAAHVASLGSEGSNHAQ